MINRYTSFDPEPFYSNLYIHWEKENGKVTNGSISLVPPFVKNRQIIIYCDPLYSGIIYSPYIPMLITKASKK